MDVFWAAPPVSRTLTAATLITSLLVYGRFLNMSVVIFHLPWVFMKWPPQLWRIITSFWLTGPEWSILFDTYFLYTYGSALERDSPRFAQPEDFFVYIFFLGLVILLTAGWALGDIIFTSALILALAYTYTQDNKGKKVTFFVITFNVKWLPWFMLLVTFIMGGPLAALQQAMGVVAAHLYDFLTRLYPTFGGGRNLLRTPYFVQRWFGADKRTATARSYGTAFRPGVQQPSRGSSSGFSSGFSGVWGSRGQGRRLGGD
ncbi:Peptidase S54, rhomboid domain [Lasallia pustulata]|uniref:Derlin n=1 Tax=Lasallia pustulata TaxID=136370 RepID=A0A1W5D7H3_9LECA|nr:Peptidase S54, rhomboid domain [Lasallia pustulata]